MVSVAVQEEHNNLPARVSIVSLPDKTELRAKSLFSVHEVRMHWQEQGKYLAVHVCPHVAVSLVQQVPEY